MENTWMLVNKAIGLTLIYSLAQGLLIYFALRLLLLCFPQLTSKVRYRLATAGLSGMALWFLLTLYQQYCHYAPVALHSKSVHLDDVLPQLWLHHSGITESRYEFDLNHYLPYISLVYALVLLAQLGRLSCSWYTLTSIRKSAVYSDVLQSKLDQLTRHFKFTKNVKATLSEWVEVPCITGYFKPIILLPVTLATSLNAAEIETILLHELAHISRNDYIVNLLQQLAALLLCCNPFAWLMSRLMNEERENCCDDLVVAITRQPFIYAQALLKLETTRQPSLQLLLAATGKKHHLLNRIQRIMKTQKPLGNLRHLFFSLLIIGVSLSSIAWLSPEMKDGKISVKLLKPVMVNQLLTDTLHHQKAPAHQSVITKNRSRHLHHDAYNNDPVLNQLNADIEKHGRAIDSFYKSPDMKDYLNKVYKQAEIAANVHITPEMQKRIDELQAEISKHSNSMEGIHINEDDLNKKLEKISVQIGKYYQSPEFRHLTEQLGKESAKLAQSQVNSEAYKEHFWKLNELNKSIRKFSDQPKLKQLQKQLNETTFSIVKPYNSDYIKEQLNIAKVQDSLTTIYKEFDLPQGKQHFNMKLEDFKNYPELKKQEEELTKATQRLKEYMKSSTFNKYMQEHPESRELKEQPEQPEKKEHPEKPEQQEPKEAPEHN